jgi:hypothetical protein
MKMTLSLSATSMLTPALALVALSLLVWAAMIAVRPRAMIKAGVPWQAARYTAELTNLPRPARDVADNYNHLMEQPTIFYALVFYTHLVGNGDALSVGLAWGYVALRVLHSVIQMTVNIVAYRFWVFFASTLLLVALVARNVAAM